MKHRLPVLAVLACLALAGPTGVGLTQPKDISRAAGESDLAFAARALRLPASTAVHVTAADWNGVPTLFVDYETQGEYPERPLVALQRQPAGDYRIVRLTVGEQEGGTPDLAAIGFANADRDPARELIVILTWNQNHYDMGGTFYDVRFLDDLKRSQTTATPLKRGNRFEFGCECSYRDGKRTRAPFKTIASVKAELKRLGY